MAAQAGRLGLLRVVPPAALEQHIQEQAQQQAQMQDAAMAPAAVPEFVGYVKGQWEIFRNHRNTQNGWSERLLSALRTFNGQYDANILKEIRKFGGSQIYARMTAQKCRAATSLLRDVYLGQDRPYAIEPPSDPTIPDDIRQKIEQLVQMELKMLSQSGQQFSISQMIQRRQMLLDSAKDAARVVAARRAQDTEDKIDTLLRNGGFYSALAEFLIDLTIFPFACIKGPVVRVMPQVTWEGSQPSIQMLPKMTWNRVSAFDLWFTPGVADIRLANVIEKQQVTRTELNDALDLPGYNHDELRAALTDYGPGGLYDNWDTTDAERAILESRENPMFNRSAMISMMEFNGNVQGQVLERYGLQGIYDPLRDYHVQAWIVGRHVIKIQMSPSPRQRHPYFITSFEKVPGTPVGNGLTDLISDIQNAANATLRSTINNLSIASGPQVVIYDDLIDPTENTEDLYPWKRWHIRNDPFGNLMRINTPVSFFQPQSNAMELMQVYKALVEIADDVSAIPKYIGGGASSGGAGRTASGLAMLMGNASKILQSASGNVDRDVIEQCLQHFLDILMLTDESGLLTGEEKVSVLGVQIAIQRETQRQRQIEFLGQTANPLDQKIMGIKGRGEVLRSVSQTIGIPGSIIPSDDQLDKMAAADQQQQAQGPIPQIVQQGVQKGIGEGIKRLTADLTAGGIAMQEHIPEGPPVHVGTPPPGGGAPGNTNNPSMDLARQAQGNRPSPLSNQQGPQTQLVGNQPRSVTGAAMAGT